MPNASELTISNNVSILLKAPYKFGKTIAACSMALDGPIWLAYWDKKEPVELLTFFKKSYPELLKNIDYDVYGAHNANQFLNKLIDMNHRCDYFGIVNDSVTQMTSSAVNWSLGFRNPKGARKDKLNPEAIATIPDWDEYKVETGLVTQSLDICKNLPCNVIWTCHPLNTIAIDQSSNKITKGTSIVSYGSKAGSIIPGNFTEIYHLSLDTSWNSDKGKNETKRVVNTRSVGDDFAGTSLGLPPELDITDKLFWQVWKEQVKIAMEKLV